MKPQIIDVRIPDAAPVPEGGNGSADLRDQIVQGLNKPFGKKTLPTMLLYDEQGLRLYDAITTDCPEYYLFAAEEEILKDYADEIVHLMHSRDVEAGDHVKPVVLELGAGALRKTSLILLALSRLAASSDRVNVDNDKGQITYFALDLEKRELERTLAEVMATYGGDLKGKVETKGMWGTYDGGLKFVQEGGLDAKKEEQDSYIEARRGSVGDVDGDGRVPNNYYGNTHRLHRDESPHSSESDEASSQTYSTKITSISPPSTPGSDANDGLKLISPPLHILFLGSSLGNFDRESATSFLGSLPLRPGSGDTLLIGLDHDNPQVKVELAYYDPKGVTKEFIMNGLKVAGRTLGDEKLFEGRWEYFNQYNAAERRHEAYYKSTHDQTIPIPGTDKLVSFLAGELVNIEVSLKFSDKDAHTMFTDADLRPITRWTDTQGQYSLWLLERPAFTFALLKSPNPFGVPTLEDFKSMWKAWDTITLGMIPRTMLFTKPIDLRHICLFYLGHIPAFLDIHLSRLLGEAHTEPEYFKNIFERGIDPHVDDPSQCHPHSEVPQNDDEWPTLQSIVDFRDRVRARLTRLYDDIEAGKQQLTRRAGRVLFMTFEHEAFHAETLLYMLLQRTGVPGGTLSPPGFSTPNWDVLAKQWDSAPTPAEPAIALGPATITLGHDDPEELDEDPEKETTLEGIEYGWDNEHPKREVNIDEFRIEWRPVSNGEFYEFYKGSDKDIVKLPASWVEIDGEVQVRTLYGPVPIRFAQHWPVLTSYEDLSKYAKVKGGRLPTEAELRLFFDKFESGYEGGKNVGFRNWHPVPATTGGKQNGGKGHNGGVWEWTSTVLDSYHGFVQSKLYPGYSADFFDGKHQVVLGGSYATIPRLAERRSLRNYYQHNYPYAWVAGRVAYDA